jgi:DNA-binding transcriptional LysR family regulator
MKLDLRQLRHVLALNRYRNFARAAEAIGLSQPALTRSLQNLEQTIGARLFDRDRNRMEPTALGERLIAQAAPLVTMARELERDLEQVIHLEGGLLRIGAGPFPAEISVGTAVGRLVRHHPGLLVDLSVDDWPELMRRVLLGELDVAICELSLAMENEQLVAEALPRHQARFYCRAGHPLAGRSDLTIEDVKRYPLAMTSVPPRLSLLTDGHEPTRRNDLPEGASTGEIRAETVFLACQIVLESDAVSAALPRQIERDVALGKLVILPLEMPSLHTGYGIVRLARRTPSPAVMEFLKLLREVESSL